MAKKEINILLSKLGRESFRSYCQLVKGHYEVAWFHEVFTDVLEKIQQGIENNVQSRIIITVPPRHGKTETASILFSSWLLGVLPQINIIFSAYSKQLAEKVGLDTRDVLMSEQYQAIFPEVRLRKDVKSKTNFQTNQGGRWFGTGVGGGVTGMAGNVIIVDDPFKSRAEAESKLTRKTVWEYFQSTLYSRLQPYKNAKNGGDAIIVIMQRWHEDDLVAKLLEQQELREQEEPGGNHDTWEVINFKAIAVEDEYYNDELKRKEGEPLWEDVFPVDKLMRIKQKSLYNWASQYQQDPVLNELQVYKPTMFQYYDVDELLSRKSKLDFYTFVDPAISQEDTADNSVVLTVAKERDGYNIYRIREDAGHFTPRQLVDLIFKHYQEYGSRMTIEQTQWQRALKFSVQEEQERRGVYFKIHETKKGNKEERIGIGLLSLYERGVVFHRKQGDSAYEEELMSFPRGRRDDRADCMSFCLDAFKKTNMQRTTKRVMTKIRNYM